MNLAENARIDSICRRLEGVGEQLRKTIIDYDKAMDRWRHLIENFFAKLRAFRSIATRYDKTAESFGANINLAAAIIAAR